MDEITVFRRFAHILGFVWNREVSVIPLKCQSNLNHAEIVFLTTGKSQRAPPLAVGVNGKAGDLGAAASERAKLARASSLRKPRRKAPGSFTSFRPFYL
jgi:hypothetical protein